MLPRCLFIVALAVSVEQVGRESTKFLGISCSAMFLGSHGAMLFVLNTIWTLTWELVYGLLPLHG